MASIMAKRNQSAQVRTAQRTAAIQKAKSEKKEKEAKKPKVEFRCPPHYAACVKSTREGLSTSGRWSIQNLKAAGEGWKGWPLVYGSAVPDSPYALSMCTLTHHAKHIHLYERRLIITIFGQFGEH